MKSRLFSPKELKRLYKPVSASTKEDNGQVTIIGGSSLFHGAPLLALKTASRIVDMVFFASPEPSVGKVAEKLKASLSSFIWILLGEIEEYIQKSDAVLIGPGMMRYRSEGGEMGSEKCIGKWEARSGRKLDLAGRLTKEITEDLLKKFPEKQWVIDGGSLQTMRPEFIPVNAILTPNRKEFGMLFGREKIREIGEIGEIREIWGRVWAMAKKYRCIIVLKGPTTIVCSPKECILVKGGNAGLTKGGTGDVQAGLTVALAAKSEPMLAACAASYMVKKAGDELYKRVGFAYNADDLAEEVPRALGGLTWCGENA